MENKNITENENNTENENSMESEMLTDTLFAEEPSALRAEQFKMLGLPSLLYALVYTICMFQNGSGITMPVWIASTIFYACTVMRKIAAGQCCRLRKGSLFYIAVMLLLGISTFLTDAVCVIWLNHIGFFIMLVMFLLHQFHDDSQWDFSKSLSEMLLAVFGSMGCMFVPFTDAYACWQEKKGKKNKKLRAVLIGLALAVPGILMLGLCLMFADAVFEVMVERLFAGFRVSEKVMEVIIMLLFGFFSSYCGMRYLARRGDTQYKTSETAFDAVIAMTFSGVLLVMYVIFCGVQVLYLFAGNMQLPRGMTYAQYAHRGFYMLLFVCFVNFVLVLCMRKYFARHKILDGMLLSICACTYVMLASSAYRMFLYIGAYQLTVMRVFVLAALIALSFLLAGVVLIICRPRFPLFRYSVAVVSVIYLCLAFSHMDYFIASYNLSHAPQTQNMDWSYLSALSLDAAPALADYYEHASGQEQERIRYSAGRAEMAAKGQIDISELYTEHWSADYLYQIYMAQQKLGLRNFNVSRYWAVRMLQDM